MSRSTLHFGVALHGTWQQVREVRAAVGDALEAYPAAVREASMMVAAELAENAIKHGETVAEPCTTFAIDVEPGAITIQVSSGLAPGPALDALRNRIDELNAARDKQGLYLERLRDLVERPTETGRLGLLRVAFEGHFDLSYSYAAPVLTVTARRRMDS